MLLQVGDVIELENGMKVYAKLPSNIVYSNVFSSKEIHHEVIIGETYAPNTKADAHKELDDIFRHFIQRIENCGFSLNDKKVNIKKKILSYVEVDEGELFKINRGRYIVYRTSFDGGGIGHGPHDVYPNGHHVFCVSEDGKMKVDFYQSGCFTAMIENIEPVDKDVIELEN